MSGGRKPRPTPNLSALTSPSNTGPSLLISGFTDTPQPAVEDVPVEQITPRATQPRRSFPEAALEQLAASIRTHGVLQPLAVLERPGGYDLIAGERRLRAAKRAGLTRVPVKVFKGLNEAQVRQLAAVENLQREDLNPVDETDAIMDILAAELALPREELSGRLERWKTLRMKDPALGRATEEERAQIARLEELFRSLSKGDWTSFVANRLPILRLPTDLLEAVRSGAVEYTKAVALRRLPEAERAALLAEAGTQSLQALRKEVARRTAALDAQSESDVTALWETLRSPAMKRRLEQLPENEQARARALLGELSGLLQGSPAPTKR
ncbi:ParB/RepB/Spo0J family partition protein [Deinococcus ficus]|uniref:ParB/RepB/Spo0J family partition protein n=1 Tax=Deinococcus ficus TaxID=317577 RepID=UPI0003B4C1EF|nr:ParB/RepB/Spo0J family partition protein [Deinococcus ficus]